MDSPSDQAGPDNHGFLAPSLKLGIMVASLAVASCLGFFLHPHLHPLLSESSLPKLWGAAQGWLTAPTLFLLLNVVVGTLYFSSSLFSRPEKAPEILRHAAPTAASISAPTAADDLLPECDVTPAVVAQANPPKPAGGLRARIENSRTFSRLVRSKSEQIPPSLTRKGEASGSRLKKAGTFEAAAQGISRKPMVIVADLPEDDSSGAAQQGHEEVDKKAEDFISRFYQRVKLQRLDSLLRNQAQQQEQAST